MKFNPPQSRQRSRRQMKKLRLGEFRELGFELSATLHRELDEAEQDAFLDALIDMIEARGLCWGGGITGGYVCRLARGSATEDDRAAVAAWFSARPEVSGVTAGSLHDCWHDGPQYAI